MDYTPLIEKRRQRLEELETVIAEPDFFSDQKKASEIMREHRRLKELLETWDELNGTEQQLADNQELAKTDDPELAELGSPGDSRAGSQAGKIAQRRSIQPAAPGHHGRPRRHH